VSRWGGEGGGGAVLLGSAAPARTRLFKKNVRKKDFVVGLCTVLGFGGEFTKEKTKEVW